VPCPELIPVNQYFGVSPVFFFQFNHDLGMILQLREYFRDKFANLRRGTSRIAICNPDVRHSEISFLWLFEVFFTITWLSSCFFPFAIQAKIAVSDSAVDEILPIEKDVTNNENHLYILD
jgi:hypothetical protein